MPPIISRVQLEFNVAVLVSLLSPTQRLDLERFGGKGLILPALAPG